MAQMMEISCKCLWEVKLREPPGEQLQRIFSKANEREKATMIALLGADYWSGHHVHDGNLIHDFFLPIIQLIGHPTLANGMVRRMLADELFHQVTVALDPMDANLSGGLLRALFALEDKEKQKIMKKAWTIFKNCVTQVNDMKKFLSFCQVNDKPFSEDVVARLALIGEGIGYLYH